VEWFWWDRSLSQWPTGFLQCFDAVGWVICSVKIVPEMTYKVSSGTLNLCSLTYLLTHALDAPNDDNNTQQRRTCAPPGAADWPLTVAVRAAGAGE